MEVDTSSHADQPMKKCANRAMHRITMPSALLSHILLPQDLRQKQVVIGDGGRSQKKTCVLGGIADNT
jgi:hypothetical protein